MIEIVYLLELENNIEIPSHLADPGKIGIIGWVLTRAIILRDRHCVCSQCKLATLIADKGANFTTC